MTDLNPQAKHRGYVGPREIEYRFSHRN